MDTQEKQRKLDELNVTLAECERIIETLEEKNYPEEKRQEYYRHRWEIWSEIYKVKQS